MTLKDNTTGSIYLDAISTTFARISQVVNAEFFDYPVYRKQAWNAGALSRHYSTASEHFRAGAFRLAADVLEGTVDHPFFYPEGLGRKEFLGFLGALSGTIKALREEQDQVVVWNYLGVAFTELAHAIPQHYRTYPGYSI